MINPMDLTDKHILVMGASSGMGRETSIFLSQLGAKISMVARRGNLLQEMMNQLEGAGHACFPYDLMNRDGLKALIDEIVVHQGKLDGLVYCAGVGALYPLKHLNPERVDQMMNVNVLSFVETMRHLSNRKNHNSKVSVVAISSVLGQSGEPAKAVYCMSKAGLDNVARALAKELVSSGFRVNTVVPGYIQTDMLDKHQEKGGVIDNQVFVQKQYLGLGQPRDVANAIAFLMSDAARLITGTQMVVDGGYLS